MDISELKKLSGLKEDEKVSQMAKDAIDDDDEVKHMAYDDDESNWEDMEESYSYLRTPVKKRVDEGPFKGLGKMAMKRKLKKGAEEDNEEWAYSDDEEQSMKAGFRANRKGKALDRLNRDKKD